jgi:hypothetical protein
MQRPIRYIPEDSNRDMPDLINFLTEKSYRLDRVSFNPPYGSTAIATFSKNTHIDDLGGNDINDANIKITIEFDKRFDYRNALEVADADEDEPGVITYTYTYDHFNEASIQQFINKLINRTYDVPVPQGAPTNGGKRKGRTTKRKTRKNKRR